MKKIIFSTVVGLFVFAVVANPDLAVAVGPSTEVEAKLTGKAEARLTGLPIKASMRGGKTSTDSAKIKGPQTLEGLKKKANKEIDRRIESLHNLIKKIDSIKKLSDGQKTALKAQVEAEIASLTALKAKVNAATDLATLRIHVKEISASHKIYALYIPKIHILVAADRTLALVDDLEKLAGKLEVKISEAKAQGKDVTALEAALTKLKEEIADAKAKALSAIAIVTPLKPEGFPANKIELKEAREELRLAHQSLVQARKSVKEITQGLHKLGVIKSSSNKPDKPKKPKKSGEPKPTKPGEPEPTEPSEG
jgi:chromosome segregation ATPase